MMWDFFYSVGFFAIRIIAFVVVVGVAALFLGWLTDKIDRW